MAQNSVDFSIDPSGAQLLDSLLDPMQENILTGNSGTSRPSYAQTCTLWVDTTTTPWVWKMFNGTNDIVLGNIDPTGLDFTPSATLEVQNNYSASANPTSTDDSSAGYSVGSQWYYNGNIFLCVDASVSAATWVDTGLQLTDLGSIATQDASSVTITGGSITGITDLAVADGGTGSSTAAGAFSNLKQAASTTDTGVVELLTNAEFNTGTDSSRVATMSNFVKSVASEGYITLPGGLIIQWGNIPSGATSGTESFPTSFSTACYAVVATSDDAGGTNGNIINVNTLGTTSFNWTNRRHDSASPTTGAYWIAIGV